MHILGKWQQDRPSGIHCKTWSPWVYTLTVGLLWKFESPVVSMKWEILIVPNSPWKVWLGPFPSSVPWHRVSFGEDWGEVHNWPVAALHMLAHRDPCPHSQVKGSWAFESKHGISFVSPLWFCPLDPEFFCLYMSSSIFSSSVFIFWVLVAACGISSWGLEA